MKKIYIVVFIVLLMLICQVSFAETFFDSSCFQNLKGYTKDPFDNTWEYEGGFQVPIDNSYGLNILISTNGIDMKNNISVCLFVYLTSFGIEQSVESSEVHGLPSEIQFLIDEDIRINVRLPLHATNGDARSALYLGEKGQLLCKAISKCKSLSIRVLYENNDSFKTLYTLDDDEIELLHSDLLGLYCKNLLDSGIFAYDTMTEATEMGQEAKDSEYIEIINEEAINATPTPKPTPTPTPTPTPKPILTINNIIPDTSVWGMESFEYKNTNVAEYEYCEENDAETWYVSEIEVCSYDMDVYYIFEEKMIDSYGYEYDGLSKIAYVLHDEESYSNSELEQCYQSLIDEMTKVAGKPENNKSYITSWKKDKYKIQIGNGKLKGITGSDKATVGIVFIGVNIPKPTLAPPTPLSEHECESIAESHLKQGLRNPQSLQIHSINSSKENHEYTFIFDYSAMNGFGGYDRNTFFCTVDMYTGEITSALVI